MKNNNLVEFEEKIRQAVATPQACPEFVDALWNQLEKQPLNKPTLSFWPAWKFRPAWLVTGVIAFLMLFVFLAMGPQRVLAVVQSLFSYLPGVGAVENVEKAVVLVEPIRVERDGYAVTMENMIASTERTWLRIKVEGLQESPDFSSHPDLQPTWPSLQLDNQPSLPANGSDVYIGDALYAEYQFPSLPDGTDEVIFSLPQLPQTLKGEAPENWEFQLRLRPVEPEDLLPDAWSKTWSSPMVNGVMMNLLQVVQGLDRTYLTVRFDTPTLNDTLSPDWFSQLSLTDEQGQIYPLTFVEDTGGRSAIFQTRPFTGEKKLKLSLQRLLLVDELPVDGSAPSFLLDLGSTPTIGQHWDLDQSLENGAHRVHVTGVSLQKDEDGYFSLVFDVERQDMDVQGVMLRCSESICYQSTGANPVNKRSPVLHPVLKLTSLPTAPILIELGGLYSSIEGPWEIDWQPQTLRENSQQEVTTLTSTPSATPTEDMSSLPATTSLATPSPRELLAEEVRALLEKGFQALYSQPGWIHVAYENIEQEDSEDYQSGRLFGPSHSMGETWQYVEADGTISKAVWIEKTPEGNIWQQIARVGAVEVNFTNGTAQEDAQLEGKAQVENLPELIVKLNHGSDVTREEYILEGRSCLLITLASKFDPPIQITGISQRVVQAESRTWIDPESGLIRMVQTVNQLEDGTNLTIQTMKYSIKERVDEPPQDVLNLLQRVNP